MSTWLCWISILSMMGIATNWANSRIWIWKHRNDLAPFLHRVKSPKVEWWWVLMKPQLSLRTIQNLSAKFPNKMQILSKRLLQKYTKIGNQDNANKLTGILPTVRCSPFQKWKSSQFPNCLLASMFVFRGCRVYSTWPMDAPQTLDINRSTPTTLTINLAKAMACWMLASTILTMVTNKNPKDC